MTDVGGGRYMYRPFTADTAAYAREFFAQNPTAVSVDVDVSSRWGPANVRIHRSWFAFRSDEDVARTVESIVRIRIGHRTPGAWGQAEPVTIGR